MTVRRTTKRGHLASVCERRATRVLMALEGLAPRLQLEILEFAVGALKSDRKLRALLARGEEPACLLPLYAGDLRRLVAEFRRIR